jgi:hypothetical protein
VEQPLRSKNKAAANIGFSMLAEEYDLIVPFAIICNLGWTNKVEQLNITSTALTLLSNSSG